jgi:hypothetical protein
LTAHVDKTLLSSTGLGATLAARRKIHSNSHGANETVEASADILAFINGSSPCA